MGIFKKIFGSSSIVSIDPDIRFGRYSDSYKSKRQYDAWDQSLIKFDEKEYFESFRLFFEYLLDEDEQNVVVREDDEVLHFEIFQGSKIIKGFVDRSIIKAEAKIAMATSLGIGFLRRMVELNFSLKYGRYALDDEDNLTIIFDSYLLDGSPYKLYYALKELATSADKQDDILIHEFPSLKPINVHHLADVGEAEKEVKFNFLRNEITKVLQLVDQGRLNANQYPGGITYLLLSLTYKLDYLIKPEGNTMDVFERVHRNYFAQDGKSQIEKNAGVYKELKTLLDIKREKFFNEIYISSSSFGITSPTNHEQFVGIIDGELQNMNWYEENNHLEVALSITEYIAGHCLFVYALPEPDRDLLHLFYQILNDTYFAELGFNTRLMSEDNSPNRKMVKKLLESILNKHKKIYPNFNPSYSSIDFSSITRFARSYLTMIRNLDLTKVDK